MFGLFAENFVEQTCETRLFEFSQALRIRCIRVTILASSIHIFHIDFVKKLTYVQVR
jgi:hypothetical protein